MNKLSCNFKVKCNIAFFEALRKYCYFVLEKAPIIFMIEDESGGTTEIQVPADLKVDCQ